MRPSPLPSLFGRPIRRVHGIGVTGMGAGPLALYLAHLGFAVTGEDDAPAEAMRAALERGGVAWAPLPADCELVFCSSAVPPGHPTCEVARARGLPVVRRGELLAEVVRGRKLVAVCGSHGKTTTTALLVTALRAARFPAGYVLGGLFADATPPAQAGSNDWVVAEIDESDGTIDRFEPELSVIVNLDWDHPDRYRHAADLEATFAALAARTRGSVLVHDACAASARATAGGAGVLTFGRSGDFCAEVEREEGGTQLLRLAGRFPPQTVAVRAAGTFNAHNAAAALAAAQLMGVALTPHRLAEFPGVRRRQAPLVAEGGVTAIEDYAHHPAEVRALLGSLRRRVPPGGRLVVAFQPHRFTRTAQFKVEFAAALAAADRVHLLDVYPAGEAPVAGGTTADIYAELKRGAPHLPVAYLPGGDAGFAQALRREVGSGDLVAFVGAGDIDRRARDWLAAWTEGREVERRWDDIFGALAAGVSPASRVRREEPLAKKTTLQVGGAARLYAEPASVADLQFLLTTARARGVPVHMLGRGSNLVVPDEGVDGLVIALAHEAWAGFEPAPDGSVRVGAGLRLKNLCGLAAAAGLVGFEFLEGIPGNVGGALRMNAGAMGGWMFDVVTEVEVLTRDGEVQRLPRAAMHVDYRHCAELEDAIALGARLRPAAQAEAAAINARIAGYRSKRRETQPREPSAGCMFKNPPGDSAGRLIDQCGLKGERVGDAEVSRVHANFIVNHGRATGADVLELVRRVRARVRQATGVELQPEALLYGRRWEDVL